MLQLGIEKPDPQNHKPHRQGDPKGAEDRAAIARDDVMPSQGPCQVELADRGPEVARGHGKLMQSSAPTSAQHMIGRLHSVSRINAAGIRSQF